MSEEQQASQCVALPHDGWLLTLQALLLILVIALFLVTFTVQPFRIPSQSMEPTLKVGDFLMVDKQSFAAHGALDRVLPPAVVQRGDLVVFHFPPDPSLHLVKRVVALPGDRLRLRAGKLFVNGNSVDEPYAFFAPAIPDIFRDDFPALHNISASVDPQWWHVLRRNVRDGELFVPPGELFVMGDNRNDSEDSRYWGFVPERAVVGRPLVVYFSTGGETSNESFRQRLRELVKSERVVR